MRIPTRRPPPGPGRPAPAQRRRSGRCAAWTGAEPAARPAGGRGARSALALRPALSARAAPERFPQGDGLPPPRPLRLGRGPLPLQQRLKSHRHESPSRQVPPPPAEPPQGRQVSGADAGSPRAPPHLRARQARSFRRLPASARSSGRAAGAGGPWAGRGGGRGWLRAAGSGPAPPGRPGRSVGAARPAHLAGSPPTERRRGARRERPGRRGRPR